MQQPINKANVCTSKYLKFLMIMIKLTNGQKYKMQQQQQHSKKQDLKRNLIGMINAIDRTRYGTSVSMREILFKFKTTYTNTIKEYNSLHYVYILSDSFAQSLQKDNTSVPVSA
jgi:hypothetical protein